MPGANWKKSEKYFFFVLACHELVLDGSIDIFKLSTLIEVPSINLSNIKSIKNEYFFRYNSSEKILGTPGIEPGAAG